jgi:PAS domain S-box-containing protein
LFAVDLRGKRVVEKTHLFYNHYLQIRLRGLMAIRDRRIIYTNLAGARLFGFDKPQEIIGLDAMDVVAPGSRELVVERIKHLEEGKSNPQSEIEILRPEGQLL